MGIQLRTGKNMSNQNKHTILWANKLFLHAAVLHAVTQSFCALSKYSRPSSYANEWTPFIFLHGHIWRIQTVLTSFLDISICHILQLLFTSSATYSTPHVWEKINIMKQNPLNLKTFTPSSSSFCPVLLPQLSFTYSLSISMESSVGKDLPSLSMSKLSLPLLLVLQTKRCFALTNLLTTSSSEVLNNQTCDFTS